jgi:LAS superfamily LD-carboxypeptidase LdcB
MPQMTQKKQINSAFIILGLLVIAIWAVTIPRSWHEFGVARAQCAQRVDSLVATSGRLFSRDELCPGDDAGSFAVFTVGGLQQQGRLSTEEDAVTHQQKTERLLQGELRTVGMQIAAFEPALDTAEKTIEQGKKNPLQERVRLLTDALALLKSQLEPQQAKVQTQLTFLQKVQTEYHFLSQQSDGWRALDTKLIALTPQRAFETEYVEQVRSLDQNWREVLRTELNSLGIVSATRFDTFLQYHYFTDTDFTTLLTTLDFTKTDLVLAQKGIKGALYPIVSDDKADEYIRQIARKRGFQEHIVADRSTLAVAESGYVLSTDSAAQYQKMKAAAASDGVYLEIVSAFRDPAEQREIFAAEFAGACQTILSRSCGSDDIISGTADEAINNVLDRVSPPGFSRHHTGHTIDLGDINGLNAFDKTPAFAWLSQTNYLNAKRFGFVPSYPKLATTVKYGPNPESWEYIYIGAETVATPVK